MSDMREKWCVREVIDDEPERFEPHFMVRPLVGQKRMEACEAAEAGSQVIDEKEGQEQNMSCECWRDGCSRLMEVKVAGDVWKRFRVRCKIHTLYSAQEE